MENPIGERRLGFSLSGMIVLSAALHALFFLGVVFAPSFPSPKLTFGPVYTVSLVSMPAARVVSEERAGRQAARELLSASRPEVVVKKKVEAAPAAPIRAIEPRKKKAEPQLEKALEEIKRRAAAGDGKAPLQKTPAAGAAGRKEQAAAGIAPQEGQAQMDAQMQAYYSTLWARIKGGWAMPQGIAPGDQLEAVLEVTILRSGAVTEINFEKRSGNRYFDESVVRAVRKASPFPPLPAAVASSSVQVGIRFHSSELR